ncbi:MAG: peptidylprolyl isomerase [Elusimicrobia bacterium]|nr:peptidylprolyl isomerase [Elusimicrobiota bacterium]
MAIVNGTPVLLSEFQKNVESVREQYEKSAPAVLKQEGSMQEIRQRVADQMIEEALLLQEAERRALKVRDRELERGIEEIRERFRRTAQGKLLEEKEAEAAFRQELEKEGLNPNQFREKIRKQLLVQKLWDEAVRSKVPPPQVQEARKVFEAIQKVMRGEESVLSEMDAEQLRVLAKRFQDLTAERVRARHILIRVGSGAGLAEKSKALKRIQGIQKELKGGGDFAELAKKSSEDPESASRGGDVGFFIRGWMVPGFEKAAFRLSVGEVSDVVETEFGYHLIRVEEKKAKQSLSFEDVQTELTQYLFQQRSQRKLDELVKDLKAKAVIKLNLPEK